MTNEIMGAEDFALKMANRRSFRDAVEMIKERDTALTAQARNDAIEECADKMDTYCDGNGCEFAEILRALKTQPKETP